MCKLESAEFSKESNNKEHVLWHKEKRSGKKNRPAIVVSWIDADAGAIHFNDQTINFKCKMSIVSLNWKLKFN